VSGTEIRTTTREYPLIPEIPEALARECATGDGSREVTLPSIRDDIEE
jgi:hypothetical protein